LLNKIVEEEVVSTRNRSGEFSFYPLNNVGIYLYSIECKWGRDLESQALYFFKIEVTKPLELNSDIGDIVNKFNQLGDIEIRKISEEYLFVDPVRVTIGEESINIYEYESREETEFQKTLIDKDGSGILTLSAYEHNMIDEETEISPVMITWASYPHFYSKDNLIAFYVGEDEAVLNTLEKIFGKIFAGHQ